VIAIFFSEGGEVAVRATRGFLVVFSRVFIASRFFGAYVCIMIQEIFHTGVIRF
jgi:hypothetical protein